MTDVERLTSVRHGRGENEVGSFCRKHTDYVLHILKLLGGEFVAECLPRDFVDAGQPAFGFVVVVDLTEGAEQDSRDALPEQSLPV